MRNKYLVLGAFLAGLAVAAGAFGAHGLENMVTPNRLDTFNTGVQYHMYHALALILVGLLNKQHPNTFNTPGICFLAGILLFSGSLYILVLTDTPWLGAITPFGGVAFIVGWILLGLRAFKSDQ